MSTLQAWLGFVFILVLVYLIVAPGMNSNQIIGSLGQIQIDTIKALQART